MSNLERLMCVDEEPNPKDETVETTDKDFAVWDWLPFIFQCNNFDFRHLIYQVTHLIHLHTIRRISSRTNIISGTVRDSQRYTAKIPQRRKVLCSRFIGLLRFKGFSNGFFLSFKCVICSFLCLQSLSPKPISKHIAV